MAEIINIDLDIMKRFICRLLLASLVLHSGISVSAQKLKKSVTWEKIQANPAPLPVIGELLPSPSAMQEGSFWSVGSETLDRDYADFEKYRKYLKETGVGYARLQSGWAKTEQVKGVYDFSWIDAHVDGLIAEGIKPWVCLCYGNPIYSDHGKDLNAKLFPDGEVMDAWLNYVKACVTRYKDKVVLWEVWNEPDGGKKKDSYPLYSNLFIRTAELIREIAPQAKIAALGVCKPDKEYIRHFLRIVGEKNKTGLIDYITYHAYEPHPEKIVPHVEQLRKDVDAYSPSIGLIQGETGCPGQLEYGHAMKGIEWTEYSQAKWDLRQSLSHFGMGVPYSFFTMVDLNYGWMLQSFGLIRMNGRKEPVYKRPKFYAVQHVTSVFTPDMKSTHDVRVSAPDEVELSSYGLCKGGSDVGCVLWLSDKRPGSSLKRQPMDITVEGMAFVDPVYVDMLTGKVHDLSGLKKKVRGAKTVFKKLPVWDSPVLIIERSAINMSEI